MSYDDFIDAFASPNVDEDIDALLREYEVNVHSPEYRQHITPDFPEPYDPTAPSEIVVYVSGHGIENFRIPIDQTTSYSLGMEEYLKSGALEVRTINKVNTAGVAGISVLTSCPLENGEMCMKSSEREYIQLAIDTFRKYPKQSTKRVLQRVGDKLVRLYTKLLETYTFTDPVAKAHAEHNLKTLRGETRVNIAQPKYLKQYQVRASDPNLCIQYGVYIVDVRNCPTYLRDYIRIGMNLVPSLSEYKRHTALYDGFLEALNAKYCRPGIKDELGKLIGRKLCKSWNTILIPTHEITTVTSETLYHLLHNLGFRVLNVIEGVCRVSEHAGTQPVDEPLYSRSKTLSRTRSRSKSKERKTRKRGSKRRRHE